MSGVKSAKFEAKKILSQKNWPKSICVLIFGFSLFLMFFVCLSPFVDGFLEGFLKETEFSESTFSMFILIFLSSSLKYLISSFLFSPLLFGVLRFFKKLLILDPPDVGEMFHFFKKFRLIFNSMSAGFVISFTIFLKFSICFFLGFLFLNDFLTFKKRQDLGILMFSMIFFILGFSIFLIWSFKNFLMYFSFSTNNSNVSLFFKEMNSMKIIDKLAPIKLFLIFFVGLLLCFFILPFIYVFPLLLKTMAICSKKILIKKIS